MFGNARLFKYLFSFRMLLLVDRYIHWVDFRLYEYEDLSYMLLACLLFIDTDTRCTNTGSTIRTATAAAGVVVTII